MSTVLLHCIVQLQLAERTTANNEGIWKLQAAVMSDGEPRS